MTIDPGSGQPVGGGQPPSGGEPQTSDRLRSMLAQAVEGQRDEQREVAGVLGDLRNQLLRLGQEIAEMRAAGGADSADASTINNVTVELREAVRFLSERLDGVTRMVAQRGEELADIRGALTAIDAHVRSQGETIGMLSQGLQALPSYGERVAALQENIDRVHQRLGEVRNVVARPPDTGHLTQRLTSIESALAPISDQLAQSRQAAADHSATLADQSASLAEQAAAMAEQRRSVDALHDRMESLAAGTQAALAVPPVFDDTSIQALDIQLSSLAAEITSIRGDLSELVEAGASQPAASADTGEFAAAVTAAEERMRNHVDEAVVALAEMLLRRRMPAPSFDSPEPVPSVAPEWAPPDPVDETPVVVPPVVAVATDDEPEAAADDSQSADVGPDSPEWWERDDPAAIATAVAAEQPDNEAPVVDFSAADIADEDGDDASDHDVLPDDEEASDLVDGPPAEPLEAAGVDVDVPELADEPEMADESHLADAADDLDATSEIPVLPPEVPRVLPAAPPSYGSGSSWSPEVPAERPEVDPAGTVIPERKKRWFRG